MLPCRHFALCGAPSREEWVLNQPNLAAKHMHTNAPSTDFALILQRMPQPYLVLDSGLTIVGASDAYLEATQRTREDIVGRHILEAFPENPEAAGTVEQGPLDRKSTRLNSSHVRTS